MLVNAKILLFVLRCVIAFSSHMLVYNRSSSLRMERGPVFWTLIFKRSLTFRSPTSCMDVMPCFSKWSSILFSSMPSTATPRHSFTSSVVQIVLGYFLLTLFVFSLEFYHSQFLWKSNKSVKYSISGLFKSNVKFSNL